MTAQVANRDHTGMPAKTDVQTTAFHASMSITVTNAVKDFMDTAVKRRAQMFVFHVLMPHYAMDASKVTLGGIACRSVRRTVSHV